MSLDEIIYHLGEDRSQYHNAVTPPIYQTSNFVFDSIADFKQKIENEYDNYVYSRGNNPTTHILRQKIAALEGCEDCILTSSGMAAVSLAIISQVKNGDHVVCIQKPYSWTNKLLYSLLDKFGVEFTFFDGSIEDLRNVIKSNTSVIYLESPNSLTFEVQDLKPIATLAKAHKIVTIIDNSYSTPLYQRPKESGIDIVLHSATKYLNGHSDVMAGVVCADKDVIQKMFESVSMILGCSLSPNDAFLMLRGLRTLPIRLSQSSRTSLEVLEYLKTEPLVRKIYHPTLSQPLLSNQYLENASGLFSIEIDTESKADIHTFSEALDKFLFAVSWGGYESLKLPILAFYDNPIRKNPPLPYQLIRIYIGLESPVFLIDNFKKAFEAIRPKG
jgi:cystathionine beta-lyase